MSRDTDALPGFADGGVIPAAVLTFVM